MSYIELTRYPWEFPITFETTGIRIEATTSDKRSRCRVNDIEVVEHYHEVIFRLQNAKK